MSDAIDDAYRLLRASVIEYQGRPVGTVAALNPEVPAENYRECFVRDFVPGALVFLLDGEHDIVRNFLRVIVEIVNAQHTLTGHARVPGVMPASFKVATTDSGKESLVADFGDRAIGRVAPVDSVMWWVALLARYVEVTGDDALAREPEFQSMLRGVLDLLLRDTFEIFPTLLTPDASFMIDRRMGVYGHPLEIQSLFYGALRCIPYLLESGGDDDPFLEIAKRRRELLRDYVRKYYWLDLERLNDLHRFRTEEFGHDAENVLNIYPESIPDWVVDWMPDHAGYLAGNIGPGRVDFRFFATGNLAAISYGLASESEAAEIMELYEARWDDLIGAMPVKICFPALEGAEWRLITGSDSKNVPWSYHNAGSWPCLLWVFVGAAMRVGREDLARRAFEAARDRLPADDWPEYYDGKRGRLVGRRASFGQVWSASSLILADKILRSPGRSFRLFTTPKE